METLLGYLLMGAGFLVMFVLGLIILCFAWKRSVTPIFGIREITLGEAFWLTIVGILLLYR